MGKPVSLGLAGRGPRAAMTQPSCKILGLCWGPAAHYLPCPHCPLAMPVRFAQLLWSRSLSRLPCLLLWEVRLTFADVSVHTHLPVLRGGRALPSSSGPPIKTTLVWVSVPGGQPSSSPGPHAPTPALAALRSTMHQSATGPWHVRRPRLGRPGVLLSREAFPWHPTRPGAPRSPSLLRTCLPHIHPRHRSRHGARTSQS